MLGVHPLEMGPRLISRRLPTWGASSHPSIVGIPMQLQGTTTTFQLNIQQIIAFLYLNPQQKSFPAGLPLHQPLLHPLLSANLYHSCKNSFVLGLQQALKRPAQCKCAKRENPVIYTIIHIQLYYRFFYALLWVTQFSLLIPHFSGLREGLRSIPLIQLIGVIHLLRGLWDRHILLLQGLYNLIDLSSTLGTPCVESHHQKAFKAQWIDY